MFWRMTGLSTTSPVDTILEKDHFTLEELLDEDEIIQECKALNTRLINFLRERAQVEQLLRYIIEEPPENSEKKRMLKFPFIACEIFTCEVDILMRALLEDEELMALLFSFLKPDHSHSTLLAGYFSKVVIFLMVRKTTNLFKYVKAHPEIVQQLVDLIGITSIMEVLIRLVGADENMYSNYTDTMQWLEDIDILEMIADKFISSDSAEVHANAAEILCAITRCAPPVLAAKICSPSFVGRLFRNAFEDLRPKSVLVHSLSVCISLLDPKRLVPSTYQTFRSQLNTITMVIASTETIEGMLECLGNLLKLLDISSAEGILPTTYGKLQPPLGKHRLKIVEFISVLLTIGSEAAEKELINLGAIKNIIELFFLYPFNNFLHHHVENIIVSCLESKKDLLIEHVLNDCNIVGKILEAEKQPNLSTDSAGPTLSAEGRPPPRIGIVGHMTRIANKLIQLGNSNSRIQTNLQENSEWLDWHTNVLLKRNAVENVHQWACGRPTSLQDQGRESDDEDFRDRDYDVAALASNISRAFQSGIYSSEEIDEAQNSFERDDEDVYFDDESAEVVISSLRLGDDQDSSLFTNSNWFAFENDRTVDDRETISVASPSPNSDETSPHLDGDSDDVNVGENDVVEAGKSLHTHAETASGRLENLTLGSEPIKGSSADNSPSASESEKPPEWVEWRETPHIEVPAPNQISDVPNGDLELVKDNSSVDEVTLDVDNCQSSVSVAESESQAESGGSSDIVPEPTNVLAENQEGSSDVGNLTAPSEATLDAEFESLRGEAADKDDKVEATVDTVAKEPNGDATGLVLPP